MLISVIIPTYNRCKILKECLMSLERQNLPKKDFEVIVIDDGSRDQTKKLVQGYKGNLELFYYRKKNEGQGIARNYGLKKAKGKIIVFIGDDIICLPDFLTEHLRLHLWHGGEEEAVLGYTTWHPKLTITPFMRWLTNGSSILGMFGGHQFAYEKLLGKDFADFNFFYTSNISIKKSLLEKYPFDSAFSGYGWEDIELGYRLHKRVGLKLYYNKYAIAYHDHAMTEDSLNQRMRQIGFSAKIIDKKYPELKKVPKGMKKTIFMIISGSVCIMCLRFIRNITQGKICSLYYYALSKKYFLEGLNIK